MTSTLTVLIVVLTVVVVVALVSLSRRRTAGANSQPKPDTSLATSGDGPSEHLAERSPDDVVLVPLPNETGQALVVGPEDALAVFDEVGLTERSTTGRSGPVPQLVRDAMSTGGLAATDQFRRGVDSGRIVALAPETMKHLAKGKPVTDTSGNMLGLVRGEKGRLSHVMRFDKAGAQAAAASNMATLAVTAALSQQLEAISQQLQEMSETLEGMVRDKDRERLSDALAANEILFEIAENVRRRGITQADYNQLASLKLRVTSLQIETTAKLAEIAPGGVAKMNRAKRRDLLESLYERERLEYWLAVQVQADLGRTRCDLLTLLWEHHEHPETAVALNKKVAEKIRERQLKAAAVGEALRTLSDPTSQTRLDPMRVIARHHLGKAHARMDDLLRTHGTAFAGPDEDPHTVPPAALEAAATADPVTTLPVGNDDPQSE